MEMTATIKKIALSLPELSNETSMSVPFWRKEIAAGRLKAKLVGRRVVVMAKDVEDYFEGRQNWRPAGERVQALAA